MLTAAGSGMGADAAVERWGRIDVLVNSAGQRMNNVLPGFIDSLPETAARRQRIPLGRYGRVREVSALIAFLASDEAAYVTGQNIRVDGGITRSV